MKTYNKLIRDKIPEIIKNNNENPKIRILDTKEFKEELLKKLVEESNEVLKSKSKKELVKEIGDVLEVTDCLIKTFKLNKKDIDSIKKQRKKSRGGFEKRLFLEHVK